MYHKVNRERIELNIIQYVTRTATRVDELAIEAFVYLSAQTLDIDFDQVGKRIEAVVPDVFGYLFTPDNPALVEGQILKKRVFFGSQFRRNPVPAYRLRHCIYLEICHHDLRASYLTWSVSEGPEDVQKAPEIERFISSLRSVSGPRQIVKGRARKLR